MPGWVAHVGEQLLERAAANAFAHFRSDTVEELVQRLLRVPERSFDVRVVAAPEHVVVPHRPERGGRRLVVLEGRVHLPVHDLLGKHAQRGPDEHPVLAVALVHAVTDEGDPRRAALRDEHLERGVTVERA
jgi:hypothetical protein